MAELMERLDDPDATGAAEFRVASEGYFAAMGIPLVRGRLFEATDTPDRSHVAVISESLARASWPDRDPIGARVQFGNIDGDLRVFTIVGIVGDIRERGLDSAPRPTFYAEYRQRPRMTSDFTVVLQTSVAPASLVAAARQTIRDVAPDVPPRFRTIREVVDSSTVARRLSLGIAGAFAAAALLLAVLGVYGMLSYAVACRRRELAVRLALGARPGDVRRLVLGDVGRLVLVGLALGGAGALAATRMLQGMLFGVEPIDPVTYAAMAGVVGLSALLASQAPIARATRVDPMQALRTE
jgi:predicted permease